MVVERPPNSRQRNFRKFACARFLGKREFVFRCAQSFSAGRRRRGGEGRASDRCWRRRRARVSIRGRELTISRQQRDRAGAGRNRRDRAARCPRPRRPAGRASGIPRRISPRRARSRRDRDGASRPVADPLRRRGPAAALVWRPRGSARRRRRWPLAVGAARPCCRDFPARRARPAPRPCRAPARPRRARSSRSPPPGPGARRVPRARPIPPGTARARPARRGPLRIAHADQLGDRGHRRRGRTLDEAERRHRLGADVGRQMDVARERAQRVLRRRCPRRGERVDDHLGRLVAANEREHRADRVVVAAKQRLDPRGKAVSFMAGGDGRQQVVDPLVVRGRAGRDRRHAVTLVSRGRANAGLQIRRLRSTRKPSRAPLMPRATTRRGEIAMGEPPAHATTRTARPRPGKLRAKPARNGRRLRP